MIAFLIILHCVQNHKKGLAQPLRAELFKKLLPGKKEVRDNE